MGDLGLDYRQRMISQNFRFLQPRNKTNPRSIRNNPPRRTPSYMAYGPNRSSCLPCASRISCCNACVPCLDDEENFIESILPYIRNLSSMKQMQLRVMFQDTLYRAMEASEKSECKPTPPTYVPSKSICSQDADERFYWGLIPFMKMMDPGRRLEARLELTKHLRAIFKPSQDPSQRDDVLDKRLARKRERNSSHSNSSDERSRYARGISLDDPTLATPYSAGSSSRQSKREGNFPRDKSVLSQSSAPLLPSEASQTSSSVSSEGSLIGSGSKDSGSEKGRSDDIPPAACMANFFTRLRFSSQKHSQQGAGEDKISEWS